jgi:16S rRNA (adenine1518-N6/adenine1519-N6)-dimethyltransferase
MLVRKRFGQHFLHDSGVIRRIIDSIDPKPADRVVEIGPGQGALTWILLQKLDSLEVIEIDRDLAQSLRSDARGVGKLRVHVQDALRTDFTALRGEGPPLRIVGNLPYNISTPLMFHLLEHRAAIVDMHFMLQKEVVDRIVAAPGGKDYGRLTVMLAIYAEATRLFEVGRGAFRPPPKVTSAILKLVPSVEPRYAELKALGEAGNTALKRMVNAAFSHRRKTLRNGLREFLDAGEIEACGIDPSLRPEVLTPAKFVQLTAKFLSKTR